MKSLRVLIADDDGLTLMALRKALVALGHTIVGEAGDGQQAVQFASEKNPDLVILDVRMPAMDGLEAARQIRRKCPTPLVFLSAHSESGLGGEAADAGANAYLVKPFTGEQLKPALELALANFEKSRQLEEKLQQMNEALEARKLVERAKGIFMRQTGLDEEAAYLKLQKTARNENRKLVDVARAIIMAEQLRREGSRPSTPRSPTSPAP
ncbi:MAG TPA: response regulator [Verrucomicrobiae bacterium]|nr:response regulator [Verrucomicrobiae bacterium]